MVEEKEILKGATDKRKYKYVQLPNGLKVLLVEDPDTTKSAAALAVLAGSNLDRKYAPGIAHFCEHMLFMGTKKYPVENDYDDYLNKNAGGSNAYTSWNLTNYYFECGTSALEGAVDRFAQFFISPLMGADSTEREMKAVDSEHSKNKQSDLWRYYNLMRMHSDPKSSYYGFTTGSKDTLDYPNIRNHLLDYHSNYYSPNLMALTIYSELPLSTLSEWAVKYFQECPNQKLPDPDYSTPFPFSPPYTSRLFKINSIKDKKIIYVIWYFPYLEAKYHESKPYEYISQLLGHEGPHSLLSYLKEEGLGIKLLSGFEHERQGLSVMELKIELTKKGLANYEQVLQIVYAYVNLLKSKVCEYFWDEFIGMSKIKFDFKNKESYSNYVFQACDRLHCVPYQYVESSLHLVLRKDLEAIQHIVHGLTPDKMDIYLLAKQLVQDPKLFDKDYGTKYDMDPLSQELVAKLLAPENIKQEKVDFPPVNEFIPKDTDLLPGVHHPSSPQNPTLLYSSETGELWYKQDDRFSSAKCIVNMGIYTIDSGFPNTPEGHVFAEIYIRIFKEYIAEHLYMAECASLDFLIDSDRSYIKIYISGFADSYKGVNIFFKLIKSMDVTKLEHIFDRQLDNYIETLSNFEIQPPYSQIGTYFKAAMNTCHIAPVYRSNYAENLTFPEFCEVHKGWMKSLRFTTLIHGNLGRSRSEDLMKEIISIIEGRPMEKSKVPEERVVQLDPNTYTLYVKENVEKDEENSCIHSYFQYGKSSPRIGALQRLLRQYLSEAAFNILRTKEQLGYVVWFRDAKVGEVMGSAFIIQSSLHAPAYLHQRINSFITNRYDYLKTLTQEEFLQYRSSVIIQLREKDQNLKKESSRYWETIRERDEDFNWKLTMADILEQVKIEDLRQFYEEMFMNNPRRFDVQLLSSMHVEEQEKLTKENEGKMKEEGIQWIQVNELNELKMMAMLYPDYAKLRYLKQNI